MKTKFLFTFFLPLIFNSTFAQFVSPSWVDSINTHYGLGRDIAIGSDGYIYSAGTISLNAPYQKRFAVAKLDPWGNRIWLFQNDTTISSGINGEAYAITTGEDGYIYAAGYRTFTSGGDWDMWVYKLDTAGNIAWEKKYAGPWGNDDVANDVAVDDSGNVYITGTRNNLNNFKEIVTIKYNAAGNLQWSNFDYVNSTSANMGSNEIKVDNLGNVYVAGEEGYFTSPSAKTRALLISYNKNGGQRFRKTYNPLNSNSSDAKCVEVDAHHNAYISGKASDNSAYIIKYDSIGQQKWIYHFPGAWGEDLELTSTSVLYMTGSWWDTLHNGFTDMILVKVDTSGNEVWRRFAGGNNFSWDYGKHISTDHLDNVYMSGLYSDSISIDGMAILKYNSSGGLEKLGGFRESGCFGLNSTIGSSVDDSGNVYVTSSYCNPPASGNHFLTLKYGTQSIGISEVQLLAGLKIFPNPVSGKFYIQFHLQQLTTLSIRLIDLSGREKILQNKKTFHPGEVDLNPDAGELQSGIYFLEFLFNESRVIEKLIVVK